MKTVTLKREVRHKGEWLKEGATVQVTPETALAWERRGWATVAPPDPKPGKKG